MNIKDKALAVIEGLTLEAIPTKELVELCYKFAHIARGRCPHEDWVQELDEVYKALVKNRVIDEVKE